jgi:hypothetical protein
MNKALLLHLWMFSIGFLFSNLLQTTFNGVFRTLIAFPVGWAVFGISATMVYAVYFTAISQVAVLVVVALITLALLLTNVIQRCLSKHAIVSAAAGLIVLTAASICVDVLRIVTITPDSSYLARFGQNIGLGNFEASRMVFSQWGPVIPLIHSLTKWLNQRLYWQYEPLFALNLVALVWYTVYTVIRPHRSFVQSVAGAGILISVMTCSNIFVFHIFYIHVNIIAATYLYLAVVSVIAMAEQRGKAYEIVALLSLITFSLIRLEAPLFAIVILLVMMFRNGYSYVDRLKVVIPFTVVLIAWHARVYFFLPQEPDILSKRFVLAMIAVLIGFGLFTLSSGSKPLSWIVKQTPGLTVVGLMLTSTVLTMLKSAHMGTSLKSIARNILFEGNWGYTWYLIIFLAAVAYFVPRDATGLGDGADHPITMVLVSYIVLVYSLAYFTNAYHPGEIDSANRLMLQLMPLVILYFAGHYVSVIQPQKD